MLLGREALEETVVIMEERKDGIWMKVVVGEA